MTAVIEILQSISDYRPDEKDYDQIWDEFQSQTNYFGLVALDENVDVVGYGSIFIERKIRGGKMGHIEDIAVHPDFRKAGVANRLTKTLLSTAFHQGAFMITLTTRIPRYFSRFGFRIIETYDNSSIMLITSHDYKKIMNSVL